MVWHDCKSDPPKEDGWYVLITKFNNHYFWDKAQYRKISDYWETEEFGTYTNVSNFAVKWAKVELPE